jgi:ankyrin repeat protein
MAQMDNIFRRLSNDVRTVICRFLDDEDLRSLRIAQNSNDMIRKTALLALSHREIRRLPRDIRESLGKQVTPNDEKAFEVAKAVHIYLQSGNNARERYGRVQFNNAVYSKLLIDVLKDFSGREQKSQQLILDAKDGSLARIAITLGQDEIWIDAADKDGRTALHWAALKGHTEIVKILLGKGAEVNFADKDSQTALNKAAYRGHTEIVKMFLKNGAEVNFADKDSQTALNKAAYRGHTEIVKMFLKNGAEVNSADKDGQTALHAAASWGHAEIVEMLLENGAEVHSADKSGQTALDWADLNGHTEIVEMLRKSGAS